MRHLRTLAKFGVRPQKLIFICPSCKGIEAKELIHTRGTETIPNSSDPPNLPKSVTR
jgi:hypothetical protein